MTELNKYLDLVDKLSKSSSAAEKRKIGSGLVALLKSENLSISRSAKYKLRALFAPSEGIPKEFAGYGPAELAEIVYWEKQFSEYLTSNPQ